MFLSDGETDLLLFCSLLHTRHQQLSVPLKLCLSLWQAFNAFLWSHSVYRKLLWALHKPSLWCVCFPFNSYSVTTFWIRIRVCINMPCPVVLWYCHPPLKPFLGQWAIDTSPVSSFSQIFFLLQFSPHVFSVSSLPFLSPVRSTFISLTYHRAVREFQLAISLMNSDTVLIACDNISSQL